MSLTNSSSRGGEVETVRITNEIKITDGSTTYLDASIPSNALVSNFSNNVFNNNVTIGGTLTVSEFTISDLEITDSVWLGASANAGDSLDMGIFYKYVDNGNDRWTGLYRESDTKKWIFVKNLTVKPAADIVPNNYLRGDVVLGNLYMFRGYIQGQAKDAPLSLITADESKELMLTTDQDNNRGTLSFTAGGKLALLNATDIIGNTAITGTLGVTGDITGNEDFILNAAASGAIIGNTTAGTGTRDRLALSCYSSLNPFILQTEDTVGGQTYLHIKNDSNNIINMRSNGEVVINGAVGIGGAIGVEKLKVSGTSLITGTLTINDNLALHGANSSIGIGITAEGDGSRDRLSLTCYSSNVPFVFRTEDLSTNKYLRFRYDTTNIMSLQSSGNLTVTGLAAIPAINIGTGSTASVAGTTKLDVGGHVMIRGDIQAQNAQLEYAFAESNNNDGHILGFSNGGTIGWTHKVSYLNINGSTLASSGGAVKLGICGNIAFTNTLPTEASPTKILCLNSSGVISETDFICPITKASDTDDFGYKIPMVDVSNGRGSFQYQLGLSYIPKFRSLLIGNTANEMVLGPQTLRFLDYANPETTYFKVYIDEGKPTITGNPLTITQNTHITGNLSVGGSIVAPGTIIGFKKVAWTGSDISTTSTSYVEADTNNRITFNAPPSGKVLVQWYVMMSNVTVDMVAYISTRLDSSTTNYDDQIFEYSYIHPSVTHNIIYRGVSCHYISGLTSGTEYVAKMFWMVNSGTGYIKTPIFGTITSLP